MLAGDINPVLADLLPSSPTSLDDIQVRLCVPRSGLGSVAWPF